MPSASLDALLEALPEVRLLLASQRGPTGPLRRPPAVTRVAWRACVVMLSSHYERYIYGLNEEAADAVNRAAVLGSRLPETLRRYHSRPAVEALAETKWETDRRADALRRFVNE